MNPLQGSCLCGRVRYTVGGPLGPISHCHCRSCRKAQGAAFATVTRVRREDFRITAGAEDLSAFESSPGKKRYFCQACGSPLYAARDDQNFVVLRLATLDDDPGEWPARHIFLGEKAPWYDLDSGLPRFDGWPESTH